MSSGGTVERNNLVRCQDKKKKRGESLTKGSKSYLSVKIWLSAESEK